MDWRSLYKSFLQLCSFLSPQNVQIAYFTHASLYYVFLYVKFILILFLHFTMFFDFIKSLHAYAEQYRFCIISQCFLSFAFSSIWHSPKAKFLIMVANFQSLFTIFFRAGIYLNSIRIHLYFVWNINCNSTVRIFTKKYTTIHTSQQNTKNTNGGFLWTTKK